MKAKKDDAKAQERAALISQIKALLKEDPSAATIAEMVYIQRITGYNGHNPRILCEQLDLRGINPFSITGFAGFQTWKERGRQVKKGARGYMIWAPNTKKIEREGGDDTYEMVGAHIVYVFAEGDTEPIPAPVEQPVA